MSYLNKIVAGKTPTAGYQDLEAQVNEADVFSGQIKTLTTNLEAVGKDLDKVMLAMDVESAALDKSEEYARGLLAGMNVAFYDAEALQYDVEGISDTKSIIGADIESKGGLIANIIAWVKSFFDKILNTFKKWGKKIGSLFARLESKAEAFKKKVDDFKFDKEKKDEKITGEEMQKLLGKYPIASVTAASFSTIDLLAQLKSFVSVKRKEMGTVVIEKSLKEFKGNVEKSIKDGNIDYPKFTGVGYADTVITMNALLKYVDDKASSVDTVVADETYQIVGINGSTAKVLISKEVSKDGKKETKIKTGTVAVDDVFLKSVKKEDKITEAMFTSVKDLASAIDSVKKDDKDVYDEQYKQLSEISTGVKDVLEAIEKFAESDDAKDKIAGVVKNKNKIMTFAKSVAVVAPVVAHGLVEDSYKVPLAAISCGEFVLDKLPESKKD